MARRYRAPGFSALALSASFGMREKGQYAEEKSMTARVDPDLEKILPLLPLKDAATLTPERARDQAEAVDRQLAEGGEAAGRLGPLAGVPFTVKDIFCVRGTRSTAGSRILANFTAPYTATPALRMEEAGGVMLGKVNLDEFT
jgi:aspartyl-tRNA(Asn)/glutamyl-tRNA(Gln) amidotransferase subunit A